MEGETKTERNTDRLFSRYIIITGATFVVFTLLHFPPGAEATCSRWLTRGDCCNSSSHSWTLPVAILKNVGSSIFMQPFAASSLALELLMLMLTLMGKQPWLRCAVAVLVAALLLNAKINNDQDDYDLQAQKSRTILNLMLNNSNSFRNATKIMFTCNH